MKPGCLQTDYRNMITVAMTWRFLRPRTAQLTKRAPLGGVSETRTPERRKRGDLDNPTCSPGKLERAAFPQHWPFPARPCRRAVNQKARKFVVGLFGSPSATLP